MRNTSPVYNWVKNVYSLCVEGGKQCVLLLTPPTLQTTKTYNYRVQPQVFTHFLGSFTPASFTAFFRHFNLLNVRLYTLSTVPITTKTN